MDNDRNTFNTNIEAVTPRQSDATRARQFDAIMSTVTAQPVVSPYAFYATRYRASFAYLALILVFVLGTSSTVAASEAARPGDLLFPVDRAKEEIRLRLADDSKKAELTAAQLEERYAELISILDESAGTSTVTYDDEARIAAAVTLVTKVAISLDTDEADDRLRDVLRQLDTLVFADVDKDDARISVSDDRIEIRTDTERIRLEKRTDDSSSRNDGDDDDRDDHDDDDGDRSRDRDDDSRGSNNDLDDDSQVHDDGSQDDDEDSRSDRDDDKVNDDRDDDKDDRDDENDNHDDSQVHDDGSQDDDEDSRSDRDDDKDSDDRDSDRDNDKDDDDRNDDKDDDNDDRNDDSRNR